jgi:hypothetical protein
VAEVGEDAVDAEAHADAALLRLDVDVGGAPAVGLDQDAVDEAHHRPLAAAARERGEVDLLGPNAERRDLGSAAREAVGVDLDLLDGDVGGPQLEDGGLVHDAAARETGVFPVEPPDRPRDGALGRDDRPDLEPGAELHGVHREDVGGIGHREAQVAAAAGQRQDAVGEAVRARHERQHVAGHVDAVEVVDERQAVLLRHEVGHLPLAHQPQGHER